MAVLSADKDIQSKGAGRILEYPVAKEAEVFYKGAIVMADSSGYAIVGSDTSSCKFLGIAVEQLEQASEAAADGTNSIRLYTVGDFLMTHETGDAAITNVGDIMCIWDDNHVDDASKCTTGAVECGEIVSYKDADNVWVRIDNYSGGRMRVAAS